MSSKLVLNSTQPFGSILKDTHPRLKSLLRHTVNVAYEASPKYCSSTNLVIRHCRSLLLGDAPQMMCKRCPVSSELSPSKRLDPAGARYQAFGFDKDSARVMYSVLPNTKRTDGKQEASSLAAHAVGAIEP